MKSMKEFLNKLAELGVQRERIDGISMGGNGCYIFWVSDEATIHKIKVSRIGISYVQNERVEAIAKAILWNDKNFE